MKMKVINLVLVLCKALSFLAIIFLGYFLKKRGFFSESDKNIITKIALNITLPAAIISSFASFEKSSSLFILVLMGLGIDIFMFFLGFLVSIRKSRDVRIFYMLNCPGYNIGSFSMPFIQGFVGSQGVITTCMFDTGNALMTCGGSYAATSAFLGGGEKFGLKDFAKKIFSSVSFDTYVLAFFLALIGFRLPETVGNLISTTASANGFMAMLMLGLSLDFDIDKEFYGEIFKMLVLRYAMAAVLGYLIYFIIPFPTVLKQVLTIVVFSPASALVPAFTQKCGGNTKAAAFANSVSIIISVIIMVILVTLINP